VNTYARSPGSLEASVSTCTSPWHAGDEADDSRAIEARDAVCAYVRSARVNNWLSIEQHRDRGVSGLPGLHDEVHFTRCKRNDDLAADQGDTRLHVAGD
jgi:hypothetical protein